MIAWLGSIVGPKAAVPVLIGGIALVIIVVVLLLSQCDNDDTAQRQAEQTTASGEAMANAAAGAIDTFANQIVTEKALDAEVANTQAEIGNAVDPDQLRAAVVAGVCGQASHRHDPACAVR